MQEPDRGGLRFGGQRLIRLEQWPALTVAASMHVPWTDADQAAWDQLCRHNPKLHDGPAVCCVCESFQKIHLFQSSYRVIAVQQDHAGQSSIGSPRVRLVGVKGAVVVRGGDESDSRDESGSRDVGGGGGQAGFLGRTGRLVVGQRKASHRMYPGMWEAIPAGGLDRLPASMSEARDEQARIEACVMEQLRIEAREELELELPEDRAIRWCGLLIDDQACSLDCVLQVTCDAAFGESLQARIDAASATSSARCKPFGEHDQVAMIDRATLDTWLLEDSGMVISPALRAMAPAIDW